MREVYSLISEANAAFKTMIVALTNRLIKHLLEERQIRHIIGSLQAAAETFGETSGIFYVLCVSANF